MRVTAWANPLPLDRAPYEPTPDAVVQFLLAAAGSASDATSRAHTASLAAEATIWWLPLNARVGLALAAHTVFVISLDPTTQSEAQGYRLADSPHLNVTPRGPVTRLELGALALTVRTKVARAAVQLLGLARLSRLHAQVPPPVSSWHSSSTSTEWTTAVLSAHVRPSDLVLAFVPLELSLRTSSVWLGEVAVPAYLLVTPERIALVGAALTGELYLPASALNARSSALEPVQLNGESVAPTGFRFVGKDQYQLNEHRFAASSSTPLGALARCLEKTADERVLLAASSLCRTGKSKTDRLVALGWLRHLGSGTSNSSSRVPEWCLGHSLHQTELHQTDNSSAPWFTTMAAPDLVDVWESYGFDHELGYWLLAELQHASHEWRVAAVALSEHLWRGRRQRASDHFEVARLDLTHANYAFSVGFPERARAALADTPKLFPPLTLGDINLPAFSRVSPWREVRRDVELLMRSITEADARQQEYARQRLIALDPLNLDYLREATHSPVLGQRAQLALQLLEGPLQNQATEPKLDVPHSLLRPLEDERVSSQLRHPLTRGKLTLTSKLADVIAVVPAPDETVLKLYCERVLQADSPLLSAVDRAATVLGLGHFELYVSRGKDDVGAQAFAAQTKLVLVGGQHTDPASRHYLQPRELAFAFAAELAHIRFGHSRVTAPDVVRGLLSKGKQGAELAFNLLPLVGGINLGKRLGVVTAKLSLPQINKALTAVRTLETAVNNALPAERHHTDLSRPTEALLDAHRLEQLSADRAGLVCCGDLISATIAILKTRADYVRVNATLGTIGALAAIDQHAPSNPAAFDDLKLRLGNLVAFYLSDDYEELRRLTYR